MTRNSAQLHTIVLNVRARDDVYSAMPIRVLQAVADADGIPAVSATTEVDGGYLRFVEGDAVRIVRESRIEGLAERAVGFGDVLLVDVPVNPDDLGASAPLLNAIRTDAKASGVRLKVFTMEKGALLQSPSADHFGLLIGRVIVGIIAAHDFDIMLLRSEPRLPCVMRRPDDFLNQEGRPLLTYLQDDAIGTWLQACIDANRDAPTIRSILDRP